MKETITRLLKSDEAWLGELKDIAGKLDTILDEAKELKRQIISRLLEDKKSGHYITSIVFEHNEKPPNPGERVYAGNLALNTRFNDENIGQYRERANLIEEKAKQALEESVDNLSYREDMDGFFIMFPDHLQPDNVFELIPSQSIHSKIRLDNERDKTVLQIDNAFFCLWESFEQSQKKISDQLVNYAKKSLLELRDKMSLLKD